MKRTSGYKITNVIRNIGTRGIVASAIVFLLAVGATCYGGYALWCSTKEDIELKGRLNAVQSAKEYDAYLLVRKNTVMLAGHVVDEMLKHGNAGDEILSYLVAESESIKRAIDADYTGLYGWIAGEYLDGVGWEPDGDYVATERPWYKETIADNADVTFVSPYLDEQTGTVLTTMAERLSDGVNVVALDVPLTHIQEITEDIARQTPEASGMVLDKTGQVIAHSDAGELGRNYLKEEGTLGSALVAHLFKQGDGHFELDFDGERYVVFAEDIEGGWKAVSIIDETAIYRPLEVIIPLIVLVTVLEALVFVAIIFGQSERNLAIAAAREAESASRAKSQFLSQMSHEIRTPINAIIGLDTILLHDDTISPHTRQSLEKISTSAHHLLSLINDILDMSRIESGRMVLADEEYKVDSPPGVV